MNPIDEYKTLVAVTKVIDYADRRTIQRSNKAVSRMYELVRTVVRSGPAGIEELASLLDDPAAAQWLAHQLVECADLPKAIEDKCFRVVEGLAAADDGIGEQYWLKEWKSKKGRT